MIGNNWPGNDAPWVVDALCAQTDPEVFFPGKGDSLRPAKRVCMRCPVITECADYAIADYTLVGIWGGLSYRERRRIWEQQEHPGATLNAEPDHDAA